MAATTTPDIAGSITVRDLQGSATRRRKEAVIKALFFAAAMVSVVISALIVVSLAGEAWTFITNVELASLNSIGWFPRRGLYDISTLVVGTLIVTAIAMAVAGPVGLGAAVYLSEYANPRVRRTLKPLDHAYAQIEAGHRGDTALARASVVQLLIGTRGEASLAVLAVLDTPVAQLVDTVEVMPAAAIAG